MKDTQNYVVKVSVVLTDDNGKDKKVNEQYLVEAVSVTDAEVKVIKDFQGDKTFRGLKCVTESKIVKFIS